MFNAAPLPTKPEQAQANQSSSLQACAVIAVNLLVTIEGASQWLLTT